MSERVEIRIQGAEHEPTLVYLPGLHGDWTLVGRFRRALGSAARLVETTYPRTLSWDLDEYAGRTEKALEEAGVTRGWILAESFSSIVAWQLARRGKLDLQGIILAGGFVRHPMQWGVRLSERIGGSIPLRLVTLVLFGYAKLARMRFRNSPEVRSEIQEFISRRTELDRQAAIHRLRLVAQNDPSEIARRLQMPIYGLTGFFDPVVPWPPVRRWLTRNCPALREYKIIWPADHNVLSTGADRCGMFVREWIATTKPSGG